MEKGETAMRHSFDQLSKGRHYVPLLEHAIETCWVGIAITDREGKFVYSNQRYDSIRQLDEEVIRQITAEDLEESLLEKGRSATKLVLREKRTVALEMKMKNSPKTMLVIGVPYFDEEGEVQYVINTIIDTTEITKLKRDIQQIQEEKQAAIYQLEQMETQAKETGNAFVYKSKAMSDIMDRVQAVARTDATVLIQGESGTGKELIARRIHDQSPRRDKPFIKINCSAIPETLLEAEFFGYDAGTFTGGLARGKSGILEHADHGTLLLDEIGDMPMSLQAKLLRVLQEREFTKVGGHQPIPIDIRFLAATNADIPRLIREKKFREDLYYRLNVIPIHIPSLSQRKEDIPLLVYYFVNQLNRKYGTQKTASYELVESMMRWEFQGNVRELYNLVERMLLLSPNTELTRSDFERVCGIEEERPLDEPLRQMSSQGRTYDEMVEDYERRLLREYYQKYHSTHKMAMALGKNQSSIYRRMKNLGIALD